MKLVVTGCKKCGTTNKKLNNLSGEWWCQACLDKFLKESTAKLKEKR